MKNYYYKNIEKPIIGLAPMDGITDAPFRYIHAKYGNPPPDLIYTEFVSTEGLIRGIERLFEKLIWHDFNIPIIAQVFGNRPLAFYHASQILCELGFAGIDINMGCPAKNITKKGKGAALILEPQLAKKIVSSTYLGIKTWVEKGLKPDDKIFTKKTINKLLSFKKRLTKFNKKIIYKQRKEIPISIKTRIGYEKPETQRWVNQLIDMKPLIISIHGRTLKQGYSNYADWEELAKASEIIHKNSNILFFANGDITNKTDAENCLDITNADGLLIGRATYGDPWTISKIKKHLKSTCLFDKTKKICLKDIMLEHTKKHQEIKSKKAFYQMRKHLAWYIKGEKDAKNLRSELVRVNNFQELNIILDNSKYEPIVNKSI